MLVQTHFIVNVAILANLKNSQGLDMGIELRVPMKMTQCITACENFNLWITRRVSPKIWEQLDINAGRSKFSSDAYFPQVMRYPVDKRFWEKLSTAVDKIVETMVTGFLRCGRSCRNTEKSEVDNIAELCSIFVFLRSPKSTAEFNYFSTVSPQGDT